MGRRPCLGQFTFGLAFVAIGLAWLIDGEGLGPGWLAVVSLLALALGVAAVLTALARAVRPRG